ncbi:DUF6660 family protein [uncultured Formosa sp.]|uniref:DUF6660 family protein n=1 Tax=uncultured Formosa sp. TaxID=255435 RepID=UPI002609146D|nr:DUF6660 family protein [uncultured Formosa sp.]
MKFIAIILSIYILGLNFTPCEDVVSVDGGIEQKVSELSEHNDTNHNHDTSDLCSPFCQCHCCQINVVQFHPLEISFTDPDISTKVFLHFDSLGQDFNQTLLQPPRV